MPEVRSREDVPEKDLVVWGEDVVGESGRGYVEVTGKAIGTTEVSEMTEGTEEAERMTETTWKT